MRKSYRPVIIIFIISLLIGYFIIGIPKRLNLSYNALEYQLGNAQLQSLTNVSLDGWYYDRAFRKDSFAGTVHVGDKAFSNVKITKQDMLNILMSYDRGKGEYDSFGEIIIGDYCKEITICLFEPTGGWSSGDGKMISAPAASRAEALDISNRLMQGRLVKALE